jgi:hypothetical protein
MNIVGRPSGLTPERDSSMYIVLVSHPHNFRERSTQPLDSHHRFLIERYPDSSTSLQETNSRWRNNELSSSKRLASHLSLFTIIRFENLDKVRSRSKCPLLVSHKSAEANGCTSLASVKKERTTNAVRQVSTLTTKEAETPACSSQTSSLPYSARTSSES